MNPCYGGLVASDHLGKGHKVGAIAHQSIAKQHLQATPLIAGRRLESYDVNAWGTGPSFGVIERYATMYIA